MSYQLTRQQLLADLHKAYFDARRHKRSKPYQQHFERRADEYLETLCDELWTRTYQPQPSTCFIITDPKRREVFAAQFRDRIVHHLYYNYAHTMLERTFIHDSYSCIKRRGTHYGIARLESHIRRESRNYTTPCYVLKMDINGYFMHIDRQRLLSITLRQLRRMASHRVDKRHGKPEAEHSLRWRDKVDMDFVEYLSRVIILLDATQHCRRRGSPLQWVGLPHSKSLFHSPAGCGLPIGNLTSQLFSNVYLNELDQYVKRILKVGRYGRYVDDFFIVSSDRERLLQLCEPIAQFLSNSLGLSVNTRKTVVCDISWGVEFLGAYLKPRRRYVSHASLERIRAKVHRLAWTATKELWLTKEGRLSRQQGSGNSVSQPVKLRDSLNSFLGLLAHYRSYHIRRRLFLPFAFAWYYGYYQRGMGKYVLKAKYQSVQKKCLPMHGFS